MDTTKSPLTQLEDDIEEAFNLTGFILKWGAVGFAIGMTILYFAGAFK